MLLKNLKSKVVMVTGANSGVGKVAARELAKTGATVVMLCRNKLRGEQARQEIIQASGNPDVELLLCDLASREQIRQAVSDFKTRHLQLDILLNNAGFVASGYSRSDDGLEMTMAVNHFGPFLLTNLLLDRLQAAKNARVVNVSSEANRFSGAGQEDIIYGKGYSNMKAYNFSKLANIMFTHEIAKRWASYGIVSSACHPGFVNSAFFSKFKGPTKVFLLLARPFMVTSEEGAETPLYLCLSDAVGKINGKYFKNKKVATANPDGFNDGYTTRLWQTSEEVTGLKQAPAEQ